MKSYSYRLSASFSAKQHKLDLATNRYSHDPIALNASSVPSNLSSMKPSQRRRKRYQSGQDAFFVTTVPSSGSVALSVVDGVGGWVDSGVDPADFAHSLCEYMASRVITSEDQVDPKPLALLQSGYERVMQDDSIAAGGSTACVAVATKTGHLEVANLGDSGYAHLSPLRIAHMSEAQTHAFNTPYQMSKVPAELVRQMQLFGSEHFAQKPADADIYRHKLSHGDVLVFATDGVWDNLSPEDVLRIVSAIMVKARAWEVDGKGGAKASPGLVIDEREDQDLSAILAKAIVREAKECSLNSTRDGPFAKELKRQVPFENYRGGKPDDICVIVGVVVEDTWSATAKL